MKDYTLGKKVWILNYEKKNNEIILHLSDKTKTSIPYTPENEKKILKSMEEQVKYAEENCLTMEEQQYYMKREKSEIEWINFGSTFFGSSLTATGIVGMIISPDVVAVVITGIGLLFSLPHIVTRGKILNLNNLINDYYKNKFFVDDKNYFKQYDLRKRKDLVLKNISRKTKEILQKPSVNPEIPSININSIDKMSLKDLKQIKENLTNLTYFEVDNMEYPEEKGVSYTKK